VSTVASAAGPVAARVEALRRDDATWDAFVASSPFGFHTQLSPWARVKAANGWSAERVVADGGSGPIGAQVLVRRVGPGPFALGYAPRGPVATTWDGDSLEAFGVALRRSAKRLRLTHVTVEPPMETAEGRKLFTDARWRPADDIQPKRTREVRLERTEEELWSDLRSKWRQYAQKARRSGVVITQGGRNDLETFYSIFVDTARRTGFIPRTLDSYRVVWDAFEPSGAVQLLFARLPGGEAVATLFLLRCGRRVTEPYGGMTASGAESRANYLLKWEAIRRASRDNAAVYDMWGIAHPGIEQFKAGFGGRETSYIGALDLVTLPLLRDGIVHGRRLYLRLARRRYAAREGRVVVPADAP
jgi:peptidoglycan pentaglycine glycine transferase (the first glycine)